MGTSGKQVVVFDRDNTLIVNDGYLGDPAGVKLMPGAADAVARAGKLGYAVVVVSNQSGVARGLFTEDAVRAVNRRVEELLAAENPGAKIDRQEFCPYHPAGAVEAYRRDSDLRKPRPGMIIRAQRELGLAAGGWCVGDAPRDMAAGRAAGLRTILFKPQGIPVSEAAAEGEGPGGKTDNDGTGARVGAGAGAGGAEFEVTTLEAAMDIIEKEQSSSASQASPAGGPAPGNAKLEKLLEQVLVELKRQNISRGGDFSVTTMVAGIVQVLVPAVLLLTYFYHDPAQPNRTVFLLLLAGVFQAMVTSLLLMGRK